ncbi:MAG: hypothetical protein JOZ69_23980 [Myxococcales bacterium]|nr:hypothetical protein [Myxococcales bacterium]
MGDVARIAAAAVQGKLGKGVFGLGGPEPLDPFQVLAIFAELGGPPVTVQHVPTADLEEQAAQAAARGSALEEAYAVFMWQCARGLVVDDRGTSAQAGGPLRSVRDFAKAALAQAAAG